MRGLWSADTEPRSSESSRWALQNREFSRRSPAGGDACWRTMGEDDPYQRQWNLKPRIDALRAESAAIRNHTDAEFQRRMTDMGTERDRLARQKAASEQAAKAAEQQVEQERKLAGEKGREAEHMEALAAAAEAKGDAVEAEELREAVRGTLASQEAHVARARQAQLDAATTRVEASAHDRRLTEADVRIEDSKVELRAAEGQLDKLEDQARLYEQARTKFAEASLAGDDIPRRAGAEVEAEALLSRAQAIVVDRAAIRAVMPDLPEKTPGIDDPAPPLPEGARGIPDDDLSLHVGPSDGEPATADSTVDDVVGDTGGYDEPAPADATADGLGDDVAPAAAADDTTWNDGSPGSFDAPADDVAFAADDPFADASTAAYDGGAEVAYDDAPSDDDQAGAFADADAFDA